MYLYLMVYQVHFYDNTAVLLLEYDVTCMTFTCN